MRGKFIYVGDQKLYVRGVTYGPFGPEANGKAYGDRAAVERDFARIAAHGMNAVRTYTVPPRWLLDAARRHGLYVMVGLPWEQHVAFLEDDGRPASIERRVREGVRSCRAHPAVLCYAIGNEIPPSIVRWYGPRRVERFLKRLYRAAKAEDPGALVTYVNFPTTEYLQLPFADFLCFNVYLESRQDFEAYLTHLQHRAEDRPLVMAEIGLDSRRNGEDQQAQVLRWQIQAAYAAGCAGAFVFSWTDKWHRGGQEVEDWDFGLTRRDRSPKPALAAAERAFAQVPFPQDEPWPSVSVIVCSYNGAATIGECLEALQRVVYPDFEVIVVDDGSTDETATLAARYSVRVIRTENQGLSAARNRGLQAAEGEVVAYLDDDAYPDPHWLTYLAATFMRTDHAGVGGPNIAPAGDGLVARCIDWAPGNPRHVLLSTTEAEHLPGCNMAFRRAALEAAGGFDAQFRVAGDDVDICWRVREQGGTLGFSPAAMVWHHRRSTVHAYWRQQKNYGKAEALLEMKWPEKYNRLGHPRWAGGLYNGGPPGQQAGRWRIYYGVWGTSLFQSLYGPASSALRALCLSPEWYLVIAGLALLAALGVLWPALLVVALPLLVLSAGAMLVQAGRQAAHALRAAPLLSRTERLKRLGLIAALHLLQPLARLVGRLRLGLVPGRRPAPSAYAFPRTRTFRLWDEAWKAPEERLATLEKTLRTQKAAAVRGGGFDRWDLEVRGGFFGAVRLLMATEEHGAGRQLVRFRLWPIWHAAWGAGMGLPALLAVLAAMSQVHAVALLMGAVSLIVLLRGLGDASAAMATTLASLEKRSERTNGQAC